MFARFLFLPITALALYACGNTRPTKDSMTPAEQPATETQASTETKSFVREVPDRVITPDAKLPVVIDFNADWCPPCRKFGPVFHSVAREMDGKAIFLSVNVDNARTPAIQFGVSSIPQVSVLLPDSTVVSTVGYMTADELKKFIGNAVKK